MKKSELKKIIKEIYIQQRNSLREEVGAFPVGGPKGRCYSRGTGCPKWGEPCTTDNDCRHSRMDSEDCAQCVTNTGMVNPMDNGGLPGPTVPPMPFQENIKFKEIIKTKLKSLINEAEYECCEDGVHWDANCCKSQHAQDGACPCQSPGAEITPNTFYSLECCMLDGGRTHQQPCNPPCVMGARGCMMPDGMPCEDSPYEVPVRTRGGSGCNPPCVMGARGCFDPQGRVDCSNLPTQGPQIPPRM